MWMFGIAIDKLFEWHFSRVLASHSGGIGFYNMFLFSISGSALNLTMIPVGWSAVRALSGTKSPTRS
jgi:hypothetical protein